jgi:pimeloyl-ACP methyl ester carboxylesterase
LAVEIRGLGGSDKPLAGYDKKTMAADIHGLLRHLGPRRAHIVGHDIGAQVAFSFAAHHREATERSRFSAFVIRMKSFSNRHCCRSTFGDQSDENNAYAGGLPFIRVKGLPEYLPEGRAHFEHEWFYRYLLEDEAASSPFDRAVYAGAYSSRDAIRAGKRMVPSIHDCCMACSPPGSIHFEPRPSRAQSLDKSGARRSTSCASYRAQERCGLTCQTTPRVACASR